MPVSPLEREFLEVTKDLPEKAKLLARAIFLLEISMEVLKRYEELS